MTEPAATTAFRRAQHRFYLDGLERSEGPWIVAERGLRARVRTVALAIAHLTGSTPND
jgi:hypothetical protein